MVNMHDFLDRLALGFLAATFPAIGTFFYAWYAIRKRKKQRREGQIAEEALLENPPHRGPRRAARRVA